MKIVERFKNPWFIVTLVGLFLTATGINPETLTSWVLVKDALLSVFANPFLLGCFGLAVLGQFIDPTTPGLGDGK